VKQKPVHSVILTTASGQASAYSSSDPQQIGRIINALTEAIVARG
jgi:hypothetical protein